VAPPSRMQLADDPLTGHTSFLAGGGEMGTRIRAFDWAGSALGAPEDWPTPLRTALRILLTTNHPVFLFWGPEHRCFYNDAYSRSIGPEKHPSILGARGRDAWPEIWDIIGPQIDQVMSGGGATWHENQLVPILRHGRIEEVHWTYSYGPIDDGTAPHGVGGVLVLCTETTAMVRVEQRLRAAEARWRALFDQAPGFMCILDGPEHRFEYANARYMQLVAHRPILGKPVAEALPEIVDQGFIALLDRVYLGGEVYAALAAPIELPDASGEPSLHYLDFVYQPIRDDQGRITGVFVEGADVTARRRAELELRDAGRRKDEFLATLSHELRNPLAPLRNAAAILRSGAADERTREWSAQVIDRQVGTMARLLDDLIDVARASRGTLMLSPQRIALASLFEAALEVARPAIDARGHRLSVRLPEERVEIDADPVRLSQVLSNLLNNAAKYTDPGGDIAISARLEPPGVRIEVADSGIGLPVQALDSVFEMFSQVQGALDRSQGGLGIGLALVKALVELHGGRVTASSPGPGRGSTFAVLLPLAGAAPAAAEVPAGPGHGVEARRVLVADDNVDAASSFGLLLQLWGHEVRVAHDGLAALTLAREFRPHVAFLDIGMPGINGYEVAGAIRTEPWGGGVRLIALTGWGGDADRRRSRDAGFDSHLTKPVNPHDAQAALRDSGRLAGDGEPGSGG
jgi:signal transduction histidine kinase/ActR/RegA family two-component response regulator